MGRHIFLAVFAVIFLLIGLWGHFWVDVYYLLFIAIPLFILGTYDIFQKKRNVLRLYPLVGHLRYMMQGIRPQIQQYFIETNQNGMPFSREQRDIVYQRARHVEDTLPFGTQRDVYEPGYDSVNHSIVPKVAFESEVRITVGGPQCKKPYHASRLNVSAMSFGAISKNAVMALNRGAKMGNFAQNTGEGGLTPYHLKEGGDLIWQIASAYFSCRTPEGRFDPIKFQEKAQNDSVKMIEIKLSQGAKPGHGGVLPAAKITPEISAIRGVAMGQDCISPAAHPEFSSPKGLLEFVAKLRELSGGKPVGFKLCVGKRYEFFGICKAMVETGILPDFITVDGSEGGTGAAPLEFVDFVGMPLNEGLVFVHNALVGIGVRQHIRLIASGKVITGFDMVCKLALGADMCNSARGMMFALGCIQSRRCNNNTCPTGVATQRPERAYALDVDDKSKRVRNYHDSTIKSFLEILGAIGLDKVSDLKPIHVHKRVGPGIIKHYDEIYEFLKPGQLLQEQDIPADLIRYWKGSNAEHFN